MKKFIVIFLALIITVSFSYSQATVQVPPAAGDIIVNGGVITKNIVVTTGLSGMFIQASYVVNAGTGAGTAQLQYSLDNVNFTNSGSAYTITASTPQSNQWVITAPVPQYVRIVYTGAGTENTTVKTYYRATKYQPTP